MFLAIVGHWMDTNYILHWILIALTRITDSHIGGNITKALVDILKHYDIYKKIGDMILDNATNNNTAIEELQEELNRRGIIHVSALNFGRVGLIDLDRSGNGQN